MDKRIIVVLVVTVLIVAGGAFLLSGNYRSDGMNLTVDREGPKDLQGEEYNIIYIDSPDVILSNGTANEIVVTENVADGDVTLTDVKSKKVIVRGGGSESVYVLGNSTVGAVHVEKKIDGAVHIHADVSADISQMYVDDGKDDVIFTGKLPAIVVNVPVNITLRDATTPSVTLNSDSKVTVGNAAKVGTVEILGGNNKSTVDITNGGEVENLKKDSGGSRFTFATPMNGLNVSTDAYGNTVVLSAEGYSLGTVNVTRDGADVTSEVYRGSVITIPKDTPGNYVISVSAVPYKYSVLFNSNGGTGSMGQQSFAYGEGKALFSNVFSKNGFSFAGWATDPTGAAVYSDGQDVRSLTSVNGGSVTLYAVWKANQYTISFDSRGGSQVSPITQDCGTSVTAPSDPTKTGYRFNGWSPAVPSSMPSQNVTCAAQWASTDPPVGRYTIVFSGNGGSGSMGSMICENGRSYVLPGLGFTDDRVFMGWAYVIDGEVKHLNKASVRDIASNGSSVTLYAVWSTEDGINVVVTGESGQKYGYDKAEDALNASVGGDTITIRQSVSLGSDATLRFGAVLNVSPGMTMTVPSGKTLYVEGSLSGDITNNGSISINVTDSQSLKAAVEAVNGTKGDGKSIINLKPGTYDVTGTSSNLHIKKDNTVIQGVDGAELTATYNGAGTRQQVLLVDADNVTVKNLIFSKPESDFSKLLEVYPQSDNFIITGCTFEDSANNNVSGVYLGATGSSKYEISKNAFTNTSLYICNGTGNGSGSQADRIVSENEFEVSYISLVGVTDEVWDGYDIAYPTVSGNVFKNMQTTGRFGEPAAFGVWGLSKNEDAMPSEEYLKGIAQSNKGLETHIPGYLEPVGGEYRFYLHA